MKVALIQFQVGRDKARNIQRAVSLVRCAASNGAGFVLLPELFTFRGKIKDSKELQKIVERIPGESLRPLLALARTKRIYILAGSIYEKASGAPKAYNTSCLIFPSGKIAATYRKKNLFRARLGKKAVSEPDRFIAGAKNVCARVGEYRVGLSVCYDLRFPELYSQLAKAGAEVLCVPSNFTKITGQTHWEALLRARAIENLCYVLAPNQVGGDDRGIDSYGNSMVVDPWGKILKRASGNKEEIIYAEITRDRLQKARATLPGIRK